MIITIVIIMCISFKVLLLLCLLVLLVVVVLLLVAVCFIQGTGEAAGRGGARDGGWAYLKHKEKTQKEENNNI